MGELKWNGPRGKVPLWQPLPYPLTPSHLTGPPLGTSMQAHETAGVLQKAIIKPRAPCLADRGRG